MSTEAPNSPIATVAEGLGPRAGRAFAAIGNETRLAILLALWNVYDPLNEDNALTFSDLREAIGIRDSGQFTYHLNKLQGTFIRKTESGYQLRYAGMKIVQTIIASAGFDDPVFDPLEIDMSCTLCGAAVAVTYRDNKLFLVCTECTGFYRGEGDHPDTFLTATPLEPAAVDERTPEELVHASKIRANNTIKSMIEGVCETCGGVLTSIFQICEDHEDTDICSHCGRRIAFMVKFRCTTCKDSARVPIRTLIANHPAVVSFYWAHGVPMQYDVKDFDAVLQRDALISAHRQTLVSSDPVQVEVALEYEGDKLCVTLDENLDVVELSRTD